MFTSSQNKMSLTGRISSFITGILFLFPMAPASAQDAKRAHELYGWLDAGGCVAFVGEGNVHGWRFGMEVSRDHKWYVHLIADVHKRISFDIQADEKDLSRQSLDFMNYSVLAGYRLVQLKRSAIIAYTGISYGYGHARGSLLYTVKINGIFTTTANVYEQLSYQYVGVPVHIKLLKNNARFGMGLELYANIHPHGDYGFVLSFCAGRMAKKQ
jgi:hypothetical protein